MEFNLLYEPWVAVITNQGEEKEVSLLDVFEHAHEYRSLAGELPTQDFAVLRLLLAVMYATFTRADVDGGLGRIDTSDKALTRWKKLWDAGAFPIEVIKDRLIPYKERFFLFHSERPFYQVGGMERGTEYTAAKLIGDLSESGNKPRLFPLRSGNAKECLSDSEAARWLLYLNAFDDTSAKPSVRGAGLPSVGAGWLGKLGLIAIEGKNLFETLVLNLVLIDSDGGVFSTSRATWELDEVRQGERVKIPRPACPLELLTLQSRRILLQREDRLVTGYLLMGGDFFDRENAFIEQMTVWREDSSTKTDTFSPKRHREAQQAWRGFSSLLAKTSNTQRQPGVISWISRLYTDNLIDKKLFSVRIAGIQFADKDFYVDGIISDSLTMSFELLADLGNDWIVEIGRHLKTTDNCVRQLGILALDIALASGNSDDKNRAGVKASAQERAYSALDIPFRTWLAGIDPKKDDHIEKQEEWINEMRQIIITIANDMIEEAGEKARVGIYKAGDSRPTIENVPRSYRKFEIKVNQLCAFQTGGNDE